MSCSLPRQEQAPCHDGTFMSKYPEVAFLHGEIKAGVADCPISLDQLPFFWFVSPGG